MGTRPCARLSITGEISMGQWHQDEGIVVLLRNAYVDISGKVHGDPPAAEQWVIHWQEHHLIRPYFVHHSEELILWRGRQVEIRDSATGNGFNVCGGDF